MISDCGVWRRQQRNVIDVPTKCKEGEKVDVTGKCRPIERTGTDAAGTDAANAENDDDVADYVVDTVSTDSVIATETKNHHTCVSLTQQTNHYRRKTSSMCRTNADRAIKSTIPVNAVRFIAIKTRCTNRFGPFVCTCNVWGVKLRSKSRGLPLRNARRPRLATVAMSSMCRTVVPAVICRITGVAVGQSLGLWVKSKSGLLVEKLLDAVFS